MKSGLARAFKMDASKEKEGVTIDYPANENGTIPQFKIARLSPSNQLYARALEKAIRPYKRELDLGTLDPAIDNKVGMQVFVDTILLGWNNVLQEDGEPLPFSPQNALALFQALPDLYRDLMAKARNDALFLDADKAVDAKN